MSTETSPVIWVAMVDTIEETKLALFFDREKAIEWIYAGIDQVAAAGQGNTRDERLAWWFGGAARESDDGGIEWGDGEFLASVLPRRIDEQAS